MKISSVVKNNICVSCGLCAGVCPKNVFQVHMTREVICRRLTKMLALIAAFVTKFVPENLPIIQRTPPQIFSSVGR